MYCKHCGKEIADDSVFCQYCGEKLISKNQEPLKDNVKENKAILKINDKHTKRIIARELLWLFSALFIAFCFAIGYVIDNKEEYSLEVFFTVFLFIILGRYIIKLIKWAINNRK